MIETTQPDTVPTEADPVAEPVSFSTFDQFSYRPSFLPTPAERKASEEANKAHLAEIGMGGWAAGTAVTPTATLFNLLERSQIAVQPDYRASEDELKQYPPEFWKDGVEANSPADLHLMYQQWLTRNEAGNKLATMGWKGSGVALAANLLDPLSFGVAAATGGMGEAIGLGGMAGRVGAAVRGGFVGGTTMGIVTGFEATQHRDVGARDILYAMALGAGLGGGLGFAFHGVGSEAARAARENLRAQDRAFKDLYKSIEYADLTTANGNKPPALTPKGEAYFANQVDLSAFETEQSANAILAAVAGGVESVGPINAGILESIRAARIARTPIEGQFGIGFLPPIVRTNEVTGWIAESPHARMSFEAARADASAARIRLLKAGTRQKVVVVEYPGGAFAAFHERIAGEPKGFGPNIPDPPSGAAIPAADASAVGITPASLRGQSGSLLPVPAKRKLDLGFDGLSSPLDGGGSNLIDDLPVHTIPEAYVPAEQDWTMPRTNTPLASMGAATPSEVAQTVDAVKPPAVPRTADDIDLSTVSTAKGTMVGPQWLPFLDRLGMTDQLVQMDSPMLRVAGRVLGEETIPAENGAKVIEPTSRHTERMHHTRVNDLIDVMEPLFKGWSDTETAAGRRVGWLNRGRKRAEFMREVGKAARFEKGKYTADPAINSAADEMRLRWAEMIELAERNQVPGFTEAGDWQFNPTWVPRVHDLSSIARHIDEFTPATMLKFVGDALIDASTKSGNKPRLTPKLRNTLAQAWLDAGNDGNFTDAQKAMLFSGDMVEKLVESIRKNQPGITNAEIAEIVHDVSPKNKVKGAPESGQQRLSIDETYKATLTDKNGKSREVAFHDLLENNALELYNRYSRSIQGHADMQEVYRLFAANADDKILTRETFLNRLFKDAKDSGMSEADARAAIEKVDALVRHTLGIAQEAGVGEKVQTGLRLARKLNYMRVYGLAAFATADDLARVIGGNHAATTIRAMPNFLGVIKEVISSGRMRNELFNEYRRFGDLGTEMERGTILGHMDRSAWADDASGGNVERWMDRGVQFFGNATLLHPIISGIQKMAVVAAEQKWADFARSGKIPSVRRLGVLGLDEADAKLILAEFNKHATYGDRGLLVTAGLQKWNAGTRSKFVVAIDRWGRQAAQSTDIGNMPLWMTKELGKTLIQGRTFHMASIDKQIRHGLYTRDIHTAATLSTSVMFAGMAYVARVYATSVGRADQKEYLAERLTPENIAFSSFAKAGTFAMLPPIVDSASMNGKLFSSPFRFARTNSLSNDPIFGNPTLDWAEKVLKLPGVVGDLAHGKFSRGDAETAFAVWPFSNVLGVGNVLKAISTRRPE